jgi:hypothetical protein
MRKALSALLLMLAACGGPQPPDMKDPASVARAFVDAYNARDLARMLPLVDQVNMDAIKEALVGGIDSPAWQGIFPPETTALIAREGGRIEGPRYDRRDAYIKVAAADDGDVYVVILARQKDDSWTIAENAVMSDAKFMALSEEPPKKN